MNNTLASTETGPDKGGDEKNKQVCEGVKSNPVPYDPNEPYILVVDDDSTTLLLIASMLRNWKHKVSVVTEKNPVNALSNMRVNRRQFDLVLTDLHMPQMTGIELQRKIHIEFKVPVVIMSSDNDEDVILESLESGSKFYLVKPINFNDLSHVWQHTVALSKKKNQADDTSANNATSKGEGSSKSTGNSKSYRKCNKKGSERKLNKRKNDQEDDDDNDYRVGKASKKPKVNWTNDLHNTFLMAIRHIGLDKAVPKKILECMAIPGITRENVASHLQKYRLFLKKVMERGGTAANIIWTERALKSTFAVNQPWLMDNSNMKFRPSYNSNLLDDPLSQIRAPFRPSFGFSSLNPSSFGLSNSSRYPYNHHGSASSYPASRVSNFGNFMINPNQNPFGLAPSTGLSSILSNNGTARYQQNQQVEPGLSNILMNNNNASAHMYRQQNQAWPHLYTNNTTTLLNYGTGKESAGTGTRAGSKDLSNVGFGYPSEGVQGFSPESLGSRSYNKLPQTALGDVNQQSLVGVGGDFGRYSNVNYIDPFDTISPQLGRGDLTDISVQPSSNRPDQDIAQGNNNIYGSKTTDNLNPTLDDLLSFDFSPQNHIDDWIDDQSLAQNQDIAQESNNIYGTKTCNLNPTLDDLLAFDFSAPNRANEWNDQSLAQIPGDVVIMNPNNAAQAYPPDAFTPRLDERKDDGRVVEPSSIVQGGTTSWHHPTNYDQDMDIENFINSLLGDDASFGGM